MQLLLKNNSGLKSNLGLSFRINTRLIYITYPQVCILASSGGVIERYQFNDYSPNICQVCQLGAPGSPWSFSLHAHSQWSGAPGLRPSGWPHSPLPSEQPRDGSYPGRLRSGSLWEGDRPKKNKAKQANLLNWYPPPICFWTQKCYIWHSKKHFFKIQRAKTP